MPRAWVISDEDVRIYHEAMVAVANSHPSPWTERGKPRWGGKVLTDEKLPSAKTLQQLLVTYYSPQAIELIKARVYKARHRARQKPENVHLDQDAAKLIRDAAKRLGLTLSDTVRYYFSP